jgi:ADP-ribose pyrophosphatase YjhB (NUDIX family)
MSDNEIRPTLNVDVVLFTVVDERTLKGGFWNDSLVEPASLLRSDDTGLSLLVVTKSTEFGRSLPGSTIGPNERVEEAAQRIVREDLGIRARVRLRDAGFYDQPGRNPNERAISFSYWGFVAFNDLRKVLGGRDEVGLELVNSKAFMTAYAEEHGGMHEFDGISRFGLRLMPNRTRGHKRLSSIDVSGGSILGLDHDDMVFYAWRKLRYAFKGQLDPFRFLGVKALGEEFRLSDLQEFQDVARGSVTARDAFRREMLGEDSFLEPIGKVDSSRPGKPATLYTLNSALNLDEQD